MSDLSFETAMDWAAKIVRLEAERDAAEARAETAEGGWQRERAARQRAEADADRLAAGVRCLVLPRPGSTLAAEKRALLAAHDAAVAERGVR